MHSLSFDKTVYSDAELTTEASGPFSVPSTTVLPEDIYYSDTEYVGTGKNSLGNTLWTVRFTYPDHVEDSTISIDTGAVYDE